MEIEKRLYVNEQAKLMIQVDWKPMEFDFVRTRSIEELAVYYYVWKKSERHDDFTRSVKFEKSRYHHNPNTVDLMELILAEDARNCSARYELLQNGLGKSIEELGFDPNKAGPSHREPSKGNLNNGILKKSISSNMKTMVSKLSNPKNALYMNHIYSERTFVSERPKYNARSTTLNQVPSNTYSNAVGVPKSKIAPSKDSQISLLQSTTNPNLFINSKNSVNLSLSSTCINNEPIVHTIKSPIKNPIIIESKTRNRSSESLKSSPISKFKTQKKLRIRKIQNSNNRKNCIKIRYFSNPKLNALKRKLKKEYNNSKKELRNKRPRRSNAGTSKSCTCCANPNSDNRKSMEGEMKNIMEVESQKQTKTTISPKNDYKKKQTVLGGRLKSPLKIQNCSLSNVNSKIDDVDKLNSRIRKRKGKEDDKFCENVNNVASGIDSADIDNFQSSKEPLNEIIKNNNLNVRGRIVKNSFPNTKEMGNRKLHSKIIEISKNTDHLEGNNFLFDELANVPDNPGAAIINLVSSDGVDNSAIMTPDLKNLPTSEKVECSPTVNRSKDNVITQPNVSTRNSSSLSNLLNNNAKDNNMSTRRSSATIVCNTVNLIDGKRTTRSSTSTGCNNLKPNVSKASQQHSSTVSNSTKLSETMLTNRSLPVSNFADNIKTDISVAKKLPTRNSIVTSNFTADLKPDVCFSGNSFDHSMSITLNLSVDSKFNDRVPMKRFSVTSKNVSTILNYSCKNYNDGVSTRRRSFSVSNSPDIKNNIMLCSETTEHTPIASNFDNNTEKFNTNSFYSPGINVRMSTRSSDLSKENLTVAPTRRPLFISNSVSTKKITGVTTKRSSITLNPFDASKANSIELDSASSNSKYTSFNLKHADKKHTSVVSNSSELGVNVNKPGRVSTRRSIILDSSDTSDTNFHIVPPTSSAAPNSSKDNKVKADNMSDTTDSVSRILTRRSSITHLTKSDTNASISNNYSFVKVRHVAKCSGNRKIPDKSSKTSSKFADVSESISLRNKRKFSKNRNDTESEIHLKKVCLTKFLDNGSIEQFPKANKTGDIFENVFKSTSAEIEPENEQTDSTKIPNNNVKIGMVNAADSPILKINTRSSGSRMYDTVSNPGRKSAKINVVKSNKFQLNKKCDTKKLIKSDSRQGMSSNVSKKANTKINFVHGQKLRPRGRPRLHAPQTS